MSKVTDKFSSGRHHCLLAAGWQAFLGCLDVAEERSARWAISRYMFRVWRESASYCSNREGLHLTTIRRRAFHPKGCRSEQAWRIQHLLRRGIQAFAAPSLAAKLHHRARFMQACLRCWKTGAERGKLAQATRKHHFCKRYIALDHSKFTTHHHLGRLAWQFLHLHLLGAQRSWAAPCRLTSFLIGLQPFAQAADRVQYALCNALW